MRLYFVRNASVGGTNVEVTYISIILWESPTFVSMKEMNTFIHTSTNLLLAPIETNAHSQLGSIMRTVQRDLELELDFM